MLIGVKKRFVFIANTKAASTSIEKELTPYAEINRIGTPGRKHISWQAARQEYSFLFDQSGYAPDTFFKFGVIREPFEWILSWYNYRVGNNKIGSTLPADTTFEEFWASEDDFTKEDGQKYRFIEDTGECSFDLIIPHDQLNSLFPEVARKLGLQWTNLRKNNVSPGQHTRHDIPFNLVTEINNYYSEDYDFYIEWKNKVGKITDGLQK